MQPFLYTVAERLHQQFAGKLHTLAVVFPNRRQSVFFSNYMKQVATPPCFMPSLYTIEELVTMCTPLQVADSIVQGFALYEAFAAVAVEQGDAPSEIPPFDVFFSIGETILKDYREIDSYLANIDDVCKVLYDIEAIDKAFGQLTEEQREFLKSFWKGTIEKTRIQEKFLKLWQRLPAIHARFMQLLASRQCTTMGMAYRQLATEPSAGNIFKQKWEHIAFVGFNAFNKAEETIIKKWNDEGFASLWFDADAWYLEQKQQEAGFFLRRNFNIVGLKNEMPLLHSIAQSSTSMEVVAAEGQHAQAKQVNSWWNALPQNQNKEQAGILLADESLLIPVLQSLPTAMDKVNITMGYPLVQSAVYTIVHLFFEAQNDLQQHRFQTIHHSIVVKWLQHPFCNWPAAEIEKLKTMMVKENLVHVPVDLVCNHSESAALLFSRLMADMELFQRLRRLLEIALQIPAVKNDSILEGLCVAAWKMLQQLEPLFASLKPQPDLAFMGSLLLKQLGSVSVPFEGEPLQGVQLMGLLESRGLDFEHLIILGSNEGSLPRIKPPDSFLPDNVRRAFGLPVPEHQDAIFAYVFYRLLHRAKTVRMVYNALIDDNSTGECSRFVQQIKFETKIAVKEWRVGNTVYPETWPVVTIEKNKEALDRLYHFYKSENPQPISPSAINMYLNCRLQYFFRYLAKLEEPEQLEEGVEASAVGKVVHKLIELLYAAWTDAHGKHITQEAVQWMQENAEAFVEKAFRMEWRKTEIIGPFQFSGELHVVRAIVLQYVQFLLQTDATYTPFNLEHTEVRFAEPFSLTIKGNQERVVLSGFIDRVDEKDNIFRMVDYKTGGDDPAFKKVEALFERDGNYQNKAALQTLVYSWMFQQNFPQHPQFEPALLAVRHLQNKKNGVRLFNKAADEEITYSNIGPVLTQIEENLRLLLEELFDPAVPFDQTALLENCRYCDFKGICGR